MKPKCRKCKIKLNNKNCYENNLIHNIYLCKKCEGTARKLSRLAKRLEVLAEYGGICVCCEEDQEEFLTIDHINNDGAVHRRSLKKNKKHNLSSDSFYRWLKKNGYPKDNFQILCFNCNYAKHVYGKCPHQKS